jgi:hypothetical protein
MVFMTFVATVLAVADALRLGNYDTRLALMSYAGASMTSVVGSGVMVFILYKYPTYAS